MCYLHVLGMGIFNIYQLNKESCKVYQWKNWKVVRLNNMTNFDYIINIQMLNTTHFLIHTTN